MVRFISDRYVELELDTSRSSGLKIPNTAIVEKEFLVIPKDISLTVTMIQTRGF